MKKSELRKIIKEEISKVLKENMSLEVISSAVIPSVRNCLNLYNSFILF